MPTIHSHLEEENEPTNTGCWTMFIAEGLIAIYYWSIFLLIPTLALLNFIGLIPNLFGSVPFWLVWLCFVVGNYLLVLISISITQRMFYKYTGMRYRDHKDLYTYLFYGKTIEISVPFISLIGSVLYAAGRYGLDFAYLHFLEIVIIAATCTAIAAVLVPSILFPRIMYKL